MQKGGPQMKLSKPEILDALTLIFRSELDSPRLALRSDDSQEGLDGWDSLAHIRIVTGLEKKFSVQFELEEIENFTTVDLLVNAVFSRLEKY
jgi:acyl carrier protein